MTGFSSAIAALPFSFMISSRTLKSWEGVGEHLQHLLLHISGSFMMLNTLVDLSCGWA